MSLICSKNSIITDNLAIQIDLTDIRSWNLNNDFTSISINEWKNAVSSNLNLLDFGLTAYDNGRIDRMYSGLTLTPNDTKLTLYRIGNNTGQTAFDGNIQYDNFGITGITGVSVGNHFILNGGYLQGFFKLKDYSYELFPSRYNNGITIENILYITPDSYDGGIFYLMGARSEDKYNPYFSGETKQFVTKKGTKVSSGLVGQTNVVYEITSGFSGVTTSQGNYLTAYQEKSDIKKAFGDWGTREKIDLNVVKPIDNIKNNIMAFFLNTDGEIGLKYINEDGNVITKKSHNTLSVTGWTIITHTFIPNEIIEDENELECYPRRKGTLSFYVNGNVFWRINDFDEYYFKGFSNDKEKQIGVPYTISWGGGSFGLKNSWHYDSRVLNFYTNQSQEYIENNWIVSDNPLNDDPCITGDTGGSYNSLGIYLSADTSTFSEPDDCNPNIDIPITVMKIENTGTTINQYFIEFDNPIEVLSNRNMVIKTSIYDTGIFNSYDENNYIINSKISLVPIGTEDINIVNRKIYEQPQTSLVNQNETPFPILDGVYEYTDKSTGLLINGQTGFPVDNKYNDEIIGNNLKYKQISVSGLNKWHELYTKFNVKENSGKQYIKVGLLIESDMELKDDFILYFKNFIYYASDNLNQDITKQNLLIEQNFNTSFKGGIQKLRLYDRGFSSQEVLHNVKFELKTNPFYDFTITKGGRLIYKNTKAPNDCIGIGYFKIK